MAGLPYHRGSVLSRVSDSSGGSGGAGAAGRSGPAAEDDIDDYSDAPSALQHLQHRQQQQQQQQPWHEGAGGGGYGGAPPSPSSSQRGSASPLGTANPPRAGPQTLTGMTDSTAAGGARAGAGAGGGGGHGKRQVLLMGPKAEEVLLAAATALDSVTNDAKPNPNWPGKLFDIVFGSSSEPKPKKTPKKTFTLSHRDTGNTEATGHLMEGTEHTYFAIWVQSLDSKAVCSALDHARRLEGRMPFKEVSHIVLLPVVPSTQRRAEAASSSNSPTGDHNRETNQVDDSIGRAESARQYLAKQGVNVSILALADDPLTVRKAPNYSVVDGRSAHAIREAIEEMTRFVDRRSVLNDLDLSPDGAREPAARSTGAPGSAAVTHLTSPSAPGTAAAPAAAAAAGGMPTLQSPHESRKQPQQLPQQLGYTAASTSAMDVAAISEEFDYETLRRSQDPDRALVKQRLEATNARLDDIAQYVLKMAESTNDPELVKEAQRLCAGDADADGGENDASAAVVAAAPPAAPASMAGAPVAEPQA